MRKFTDLLLAIFIAIICSFSLYAAECQDDTYTKTSNPITQLGLISCGLKTVFDDRKDKISCLVNNHQISADCAGCFVDFLSCSYNQCVGFDKPCGLMGVKGTSPECAECVKGHCEPALLNCSGLPGLPD